MSDNRVEVLRTQTQRSRSLTDSFFAVSSRLSSGTNSWVTGCIGSATGFLAAIGVNVAAPDIALGLLAPPLLVIGGGVGTLVGRRFGAGKERASDERRRLARQELREDIELQLTMIRHLPEEAAGEFVELLLETTRSGAGPATPLRLSGPAASDGTPEVGPSASAIIKALTD